MTVLDLTLAIFAVSAVAGFVGSLTGLGGGVVLVPVLTLAFGIDVHYAMGASLVSVIATSSGSAAAYVREGFSNIRVAMFLEIATSLGAIVGATLVAIVPTAAIAVIFGLVLLYSAYETVQSHKHTTVTESDGLCKRLNLGSDYPEDGQLVKYGVVNAPAGFAVMGIAGVLSGLLGIGSGAVKVIAMDRIMKLPFKVSTTTSNFMIGVTAAASAGVYLSRGYIDPGLAMPVMLGVLGGSLVGSRLLVAAKVNILRTIFAIVISALAVEMLIQGLRGGIK
ncbi:MAG TPA: sulfite exporter TauE/SafE family protein [Fimbriimonadaceae bacterium]|jgi:hypothetical protein